MANRRPRTPAELARRITVNPKAVMLDVFQSIGGAEAMARWAKQPQNRGEFYKMFAKMVPKVVEGTGEGGAHLVKFVSAYAPSAESDDRNVDESTGPDEDRSGD